MKSRIGTGRIFKVWSNRATRGLCAHPQKPVKPQSMSVKLTPPGKPAKKSMQMIYNVLLTTCSRPNQVNPSQSASNRLHGLDQPPKVQLSRTASQPVAAKLLEGHADTGLSWRLCTFAPLRSFRFGRGHINAKLPKCKGSKPNPVKPQTDALGQNAQQIYSIGLQ
jgi:hypothetical protein